MAATVIPDEGKLAWNEWDANDNPGDTMSFRIASNSMTIDDDTVLGDFTEATFPGYAPVTFVRGDLSGPTIVSHVAVNSLSPPPQFVQTSGSPQDCYSWYLSNDTQGICMAAAPFDATITMRPGASITLDPLNIKTKGF